MRAIVPGTSWSSLQATALWPASQAMVRMGQQVIPGGLDGLGIQVPGLIPLYADTRRVRRGGLLGLLGFGTIPDSITSADQAIAAGYGQDEIVAKFGYNAYADAVSGAFTSQTGVHAATNPDGSPPSYGLPGSTTIDPNAGKVNVAPPGASAGRPGGAQVNQPAEGGITMSTILNAANQQRRQPGGGIPQLTLPFRQQVDTSMANPDANGSPVNTSIQGSAQTGANSFPWGLLLLGALGVGGAWWFFRRRK